MQSYHSALTKTWLFEISRRSD